jgi:hypothetical protein
MPPRETLTSLIEKIKSTKDLKKLDKVCRCFYLRREEEKKENEGGGGGAGSGSDEREAVALPHLICTPADAKIFVNVLVEFVLKLLKTIETKTKKKIESVCIGKSYAAAARNIRREKGSLLCSKHLTSRGVDERIRRKYKKDGSHALIVFEAFEASDVSAILKEFGCDHELFALILERAVIKQFLVKQQETKISFDISNKDEGGGGRVTKKMYCAFVLYVAIKFK